MIVSLVMTVVMVVIPAMEIVIVVVTQSMVVVPYVKAVVLPVTLVIHRLVINVIRLVRPQIVAVVILLVTVVTIRGRIVQQLVGLIAKAV